MKRILVADDSVTIQKVIALTFADEPYEVQSVGTGVEALELMKNWKPDIVLADVIMPQMNGYELCRAVKQQGDTGSIPVLLLAGTFEAFDEEEAKSVGADDFITKPFESGELIGKVKSLAGDVAATPPEPPAPSLSDVTPPDEVQVAPEPAAEPLAESPSEAAVPVSAPVSENSEPDIWDILSDAGNGSQGQESADATSGPEFSPVESSGVIDVGTFDVGIGRQDLQNSPAQAQPAPPAGPVPLPEAEIEPPAPQAQWSAEAPPALEIDPDAGEKSRVENMEKDFFGFETGGVEEIAEADYLGDAVEEVTFEMEAQPEPREGADQEAPFTLSEPTGDQVSVPAETIPPEVPSAEPPPAAQIVYEPEPDLSEWPAASQPQEVAGEVMVSPEPETSVEFPPPPPPEPPLELSVDITPDLPEPFSPEPVVEPLEEPPVESAEPLPADTPPEALVQEVEASGPSGEPSQAVPDDAAIRKIIEEKVEKIAWEVIPEMAEVMIRETIQKIKDGS